MADSAEPSQDIVRWLTALRLPQYAADFQLRGYRNLEDCGGLTEELLLELHVLPTGHRRRILHSLEALGIVEADWAEGEEEEGDEEGGPRGTKKPVPQPRHIFPYRDRATSYSHSQPRERSEGQGHEGAHSLPTGVCLGPGSQGVTLKKDILKPPKPTPRGPYYIPPSSSTSASSSSESLSDNPSSGARRHEGPPAFHGDMVENAIYESAPRTRPTRGPRPTRSYKLRHRPVPEIPEQTLPLSQDWSAAAPALPASPPLLPGAVGPAGADGGQQAPPEHHSPIAPYGEMFLYNGPESPPDHGGAEELVEKETRVKKKPREQRKKSSRKSRTPMGSGPSTGMVPPHAGAVPGVYEDDYSLVQECAIGFHPAHQSWPTSTLPFPEPAPVGPAHSQGGSVTTAECDVYSEPFDALEGLVRSTLPPLQADITPYACYYGVPKSQMSKTGWLDKLSPQGKCVFQRRWVRFDGECLSYYNNDKEMYSKGLVPVGSMQQVKEQGDSRFEVVTSPRTFVFRAEMEVERQEWVEVLQAALCSLPDPSARRSSKGGVAPAKDGPLELRGHKGRVQVSLAGPRVRLSKSHQDFKAGLAITEVDLTDANIKDVDRRGFEINTPFRTFCFTAASEREKEEWAEALREAVTETLCDYEVADKVWFNASNRRCADCRAPRPDWASVNLGVVICKKCAGQHRYLGSSLSKVRSLKLDSSVWTNELVELFLEVGNKRANSFWAANLPPEERLHAGATPEQRATFHRRKYRERKYRRLLEGVREPEQLNQALCAAVVQPDVLETMALVFSGADVMCTTGDADYSTPYLLAQRAGQRLQMEFLHHNKHSDFPVLEPSSESGCPSDAPSFMDGFLYVSPGPSRATLDRRGRDDMARRWCTLEGGFFSYYESERSPVATGRVDITEGVSLAIHNTQTIIGAGALFTVELHLQTERVLLFGAETHETQRDWVQAMAKCFVPSKVEGMLRRDSELVGRLYYKEGHDLYHWRVGWFTLVGSALSFSSAEAGEAEEGFLQLKQLQELTVSTHPEGEEKIQVLLMVEGGRTVYVHGYTRGDFALWHSAIQLAAGTDGRALGNQQLSRHGVPIIVESCMAFVTQYGLIQEGLYQKQGDPARVAQLLKDFRSNARAVKLREGTQRLEDVCHVLRTFLAQCEEALLAKELYPYWMSALDEEDEQLRVEKYFTFIQSLPEINRFTLAALLQHLYRVQRCSDIHHTQSRQLAAVFSSCLFQTEGQTPQEITVVEDLINNYVSLFDVNEDQVQQMEKENSFITRWNDKRDTTFSPAGDLIFEVYLNGREPENCCLIKLSPNMTSSEMAEKALGTRNMAADADDLWTTFEVIENGELERPLHYKEKVLEQVLEWSALDNPSAAFLVIKKFVGAKMAADLKENGPYMKGDHLKCKDCSCKLLSGSKFQDRYVVLLRDKLLLYKDIKSNKAEREILLHSVKCYLGLRRKLKGPTSVWVENKGGVWAARLRAVQVTKFTYCPVFCFFNSWGFTIHTEKQQWFFCCSGKEAQIDWVTSILRQKHRDNLWPNPREPKEPAPDKSHREGALTTYQKNKAAKVLPQPPTAQKQSLNVSLSNTARRSSHDTNHQPKTGRGSSFPKPKEDVPNAGRRTASDRQSQPQRFLSPSQSEQPAPEPPKAGRKSPVHPARAAEVLMPPDLLSELSSVLNKTGRRKES